MYKKQIIIILLIFSNGRSQEPLGYIYSEKCFSRDSLITPNKIFFKGRYKKLEVTRNNYLLIENKDYRYHPDSIIQLSDTMLVEDTLCIKYWHSPLLPNKILYEYKEDKIPVLKKDRELKRKNIVYSSLDTLAPKYDLYYGGNKSLMVTVGEQGGLGLEQSLQLDVNGQLSKNVYVLGHLSDQDIPIQPEGNTATLREVDQIFIKIYGEQYSYLLGDYTLDFGRKGLDKHISKVQGMNAKYKINEVVSEASFSKSRGEYHTYSFFGQFGKQTDYFLTSQGGDQFITILAGSEKIWKNGQRLHRGKHYQIEYGEGRVDFLNEFVVTSDDQFTVEFEYTQQDYPSFLYSASVSDTTGNFNWSLRAISDRDDKDNPQSFVLLEEDIKILEGAGADTLLARTSGKLMFDSDSNWFPGLYSVNSITQLFVYIDSIDFDSIRNNGDSIFQVQFSRDSWGLYQKISETEFRPTIGGVLETYSPGFQVSLPESKTHYVFQSQFKAGQKNNLGHESNLALFLSNYDRNTFSSKEDNDNVGFGAKYIASQSMGTLLSKGGYGQWIADGSMLYRNQDYTAFRQQIEPHGFSDKWNLTSQENEKDFISYDINLSNSLFSFFEYGGEYGRAETNFSSDKLGKLSDRYKVYTNIGQRNHVLKVSGERADVGEKNEQLTSNFNSTRDQLKLDGNFKFNLIQETINLNFEDHNFISGNLDEQNRKKELLNVIQSKSFFRKFKLGLKNSYLELEKNDPNSSSSLQDSLITWSIAPKLEWFNIGPWSSDVYYSFQNVEQWNQSNSTSDEKQFHLMEWNNRIFNYRKGYHVNLSYRINQTIDIPLIKQYEKVPEGTGNYTCDTLTINGRLEFDCVEDDDRGEFNLIGWQRDTLNQGLSIQDLGVSANLNWSPKKSFPRLRGLFADLSYALEFDVSQKDTSDSPELYPQILDSELKKMMSGRSYVKPTVTWTSPEDNKVLKLSLQRELKKEVDLGNLEQENSVARASFSHDWLDWIRYNLAVRNEINERRSARSSLNQNVVARESSGDISFSLPRKFLLRPSIFYTWYDLNPKGPSDQIINSLFPKLRLEKKVWSGGRAYSEYGLHYQFGDRQNLNSVYLGGYNFGVTHRFQSGIDVRVGKYLYCHGDYLIRIEPKEELFQRLTAEVRAIF